MIIIGPQQSYLPCPPGTYCEGEFNSNFTLCPTGAYNPNFGASTCLRAPIGFIAPNEGMQVPRICPAGKVNFEIFVFDNYFIFIHIIFR